MVDAASNTHSARTDLASLRQMLAPTGTLRAAINHNNPLLARRDAASGEISGLAVDLSRELARRTGLPLALVPYEAASQIAATARQDLWDIGFLAIDPTRADDIEFTSAYLELEGMYAVPVDSSLHSPLEVDRDGVLLAVTAGSAYDLYLSRELRHAQLVRAPSNPSSLQLLFERRVDAVAAVRTMLVKALRQRNDCRILEGHFMTIPQAAGVPKGRDEAARYVSGFIAEARDGGFVAECLARHGLGPDDALVARADP